MAEETTQVQPSWVTNTQDIVKLLMQGQPPAAGQADAATTISNPWLKALEAETAASQNVLPQTGGAAAPQYAQAHELRAQMPAKPVTPLALPQTSPVGQLPMATVMQMGQHQVSPAVELAKQRVVQALMQRHTPATAKV